jgi:hypothetical protein
MATTKQIAALLNIHKNNVGDLNRFHPTFPSATNVARGCNLNFDEKKIAVWASENNIKDAIRESIRVRDKLRRISRKNNREEGKSSIDLVAMLDFIKGKYAPVGFTPKRIY